MLRVGTSITFNPRIATKRVILFRKAISKSYAMTSSFTYSVFVKAEKYAGNYLLVDAAMVISFDLRNFILRARVLKLYRQALRITQRAPGDSRAELRHIIRQEMESNRNCSDKQRIHFLISEGLERLKRLDEMLDMQGH